MRVLAALVLLLQLQPLIGSALCWHDAELARAECAMPHPELPAGDAVGAPGTSGAAGCAGMVYCAPSAPAVPRVAEHLQLTTLVHGAPALHHPLLPSGEPAAPPFHPPRA